MKRQKSNTIGLKKLTIAKITPDSLAILKGGTSSPSIPSEDTCGATILGRGHECQLVAY